MYSYFAKWREPDENGSSALDRSLKNQFGEARTRLGRKASTTLLVLEAQSFKNTETAALNGYDAGKKVSGIKRHIAIDTQRLPHAVAVTTANATDRNGALQALGCFKTSLVSVQSVLCDSSYTGKSFVQGVRRTLG